MIEKDRLKNLNSLKNLSGEYLIYWMQASVRVEYNLALNYSIDLSNQKNVPLIVVFILDEKYPKANFRHFKFLIEGLLEVEKKLKDMNISFYILNGFDDFIAISNRALGVITDRGYLRIQREWRSFLSERINIPLVQVEDNVLIPIETVSNKEEYSAATLRRKYLKLRNDYIRDHKISIYRGSSFDIDVKKKHFDDFNSIEDILNSLSLDLSVKGSFFEGGYEKAKVFLIEFLNNKILKYDEKRNDPVFDYQSNLSPYLHFGNISPIEIAFEAFKLGDICEPFLEELLVRRELSINYIFYNPFYDSVKGINDWAIKTLREHESDIREYVYSLEEFEKAETHDVYWNSAQNEMKITGKMHGYMRMYWGKKILEWTSNVEDAFNIAVYLNDKYQIDGRDPNSYTGIAWCFGKHDRAWKERNVFGKIRYMNDNGLKRKFDIDSYVEKIDDLKNKL